MTFLNYQQSRPAATNGDAVSRLAAWSLYRERLSRGAGDDVARNKPVFLVRNARARGGGYSHNAHTLPAGPGAGAGGAAVAHKNHARRKPPKVHDAAECTVNPNLRSVSPRRIYSKSIYSFIIPLKLNSVLIRTYSFLW